MPRKVLFDEDSEHCLNFNDSNFNTSIDDQILTNIQDKNPEVLVESLNNQLSNLKIFSKSPIKFNSSNSSNGSAQTLRRNDDLFVRTRNLSTKSIASVAGSYAATSNEKCLPGEIFEKFEFNECHFYRLFISKYRLVIVRNNIICSVPLLSIESVESKDIDGLQIWLRDCRTFHIKTNKKEIAMYWYKKLTPLTCLPRKLNEIFAFQFHDSVIKGQRCTWIRKEALDFFNYPKNYCFEKVQKELQRFGFNTDEFRVSYVNEDFRLCETYPQFLIFPTCVTDEELMGMRECRTCNRLPTIAWACKKFNVVLLRSSQPAQGIFGSGVQDSALLEKFRDSFGGHRFNFFDLRSYAAAWANCAKGGGFENGSYAGDVAFMGLPNIHNIRYSFHQLRVLLNSQNEDLYTYLQSLQSTLWLQNIFLIFKATNQCVRSLRFEHRSVLVHCTDGWDRTSQVISLTMLILDPYYRTFDGFETLIQRQWVEFGHKFADRTSALNGSTDERCPIFLQFLDCVYQLWIKNPDAFQFNCRYLVKLSQHIYSGLFSTFLFNNVKDAALANCAVVDAPSNLKSSRLVSIFFDGKLLPIRAFQVWDYLGKHNYEFINPAYLASVGVLSVPKYMSDLELWKDAYCCTKAQSAINSLQDDIYYSSPQINSPLNVAGNLVETVNTPQSTHIQEKTVEKPTVMSRSQSVSSFNSQCEQSSSSANNTHKINSFSRSFTSFSYSNAFDNFIQAASQVFNVISSYTSEISKPNYNSKSALLFNNKKLYSLSEIKDCFKCDVLVVANELDTVSQGLNPVSNNLTEGNEINSTENKITIENLEKNSPITILNDKNTTLTNGESLNDYSILSISSSETTNVQPSFLSISLEKIRVYLDLDGLSKISNIFEEKVVELYCQLMRLQQQRNYFEIPIINNQNGEQLILSRNNLYNSNGLTIYSNLNIIGQPSNWTYSASSNNHFIVGSYGSISNNGNLCHFTTHHHGNNSGSSSSNSNYVLPKRTRNESVDSMSAGFEVVDEFENERCAGCNSKKKNELFSSNSSMNFPCGSYEHPQFGLHFCNACRNQRRTAAMQSSIIENDILVKDSITTQNVFRNSSETTVNFNFAASIPRLTTSLTNFDDNNIENNGVKIVKPILISTSPITIPTVNKINKNNETFTNY